MKQTKCPRHLPDSVPIVCQSFRIFSMKTDNLKSGYKIIVRVF